MTKGELLQLLEPYTDETEIVVDVGEDRLLHITHAKYFWPRGGNGTVRLCVTYDIEPWLNEGGTNG